MDEVQASPLMNIHGSFLCLTSCAPRVGAAQLQSNDSAQFFWCMIQELQLAAFKGRTTTINNAFCNPTILAAHPYNPAETQFSPDERKSLQKADQTGTFRAPDQQQPSAAQVWSVILDLQCKKCSVGTH